MLSEYQTIVNGLHEAFYEYYMIYNKGAKKLDEYNLTVQQENMMLYIMRNPRVTANAIAAKFSISKSAVSQVLSKLEARHFIVRENNPDNRRESFVILGEEGEKYAQLIDEADATFVRTYFSHIEIDDLKQMLQTMQKINKLIMESKQET
ncbi:MarR family winged helix-turn-helix transcriptional regulator [Paenibacillus thalictri]|nr:MarR family winged helix-turn-helix transcriptional regulator [Paenibacillus thalictri]